VAVELEEPVDGGDAQLPSPMEVMIEARGWEYNVISCRRTMVSAVIGTEAPSVGSTMRA
jgi:hypothetical protein